MGCWTGRAARGRPRGRRPARVAGQGPRPVRRPADRGPRRERPRRAAPSRTTAGRRDRRTVRPRPHPGRRLAGVAALPYLGRRAPARCASSAPARSPAAEPPGTPGHAQWPCLEPLSCEIRCSYFSSRPFFGHLEIDERGLLRDGHDRDGPLPAGGQAPIRSRGQQGKGIRSGRQIGSRPARSAAADLRARPPRKL
jgi:hypothetical protein